MSNEESVAGINVRQLRDEKQRLENDKLMLQGQLDMSRSLVAGAKAEIARLEKALRLCAAGCDIAIQDQQARIQQLEEALDHFMSAYACYGKNGEPLDELTKIGQVALSREPSEAPEKEGEDG